MKKKIVAIIIVPIVLAIYICYLHLGRDMDVRNSFSSSSFNYREETIHVILNQVIVTKSKEEIAYRIIQKVLDNDFHTIKFRFRGGYPNRLNVSVYKNEKDLKNSRLLFSFSYTQAGGKTGEYDISQSDHMELEIQE